MKKKWIKKTAAGIVVGIMAVGMTGCSSVRMTNADSGLESTESTTVKMLSNSDVVGTKTNDKLELIQNILDKNFYFEEDEQAKQDGIVKGYMEGLDDPYSVYYTKEEYASFMESTEGEYVGVGVQVSQSADTKIITIVKIFDGPALDAGIEEEDIITEVDGEDITSQDIDTVVDKIRGQEGTEVTLTVYRNSDKKSHEYTMQRKKVENPTVEYRMLDDNIGYVEVSSFYEVTADQFIAAVEDLDSQGMEGLIVDLRDNGGGLLNIATEMLDFMLPAGKIVYTEDKDGNILDEYNSTDEEKFTKPLVVMVNGYSASASEIFAGAIKDYGIGTLVGENTFGKGIVQRMFPLEDGSAVKITIAKYFTPKGNDIHEVGIKPDVEVAFDVDAYRESEGEKDNQLQAAVENILEQLGKKVPTAEDEGTEQKADNEKENPGEDGDASEEE
ncbi:MAG: S41 family peptidase [Bacteroidales bacterium]|nr:S41 family peptidase [Clostridium sp.]MCM1205011.1 S41 family peptidase [Bacteroidales bacterium]